MPDHRTKQHAVFTLVFVHVAFFVNYHTLTLRRPGGFAGSLPSFAVPTHAGTLAGESKYFLLFLSIPEHTMRD